MLDRSEVVIQLDSRAADTLPGMHTRPRLSVTIIALAVAVAACTGGTEPAPTTAGSPPETTTATSAAASPTTVPTLTLAPPTTLPRTTAAPVDDGSLVGVVVTDPTTCALGEPPAVDAPEVTFVSDGFLVAATADGRSVRCIAPFETQTHLVWGPYGDRLLAGTTRVAADESFAGGIGPDATFTRPTGRNLVWVEDGRLWKSGFDGSDVRDISFLGTHVAVAYHPAGVEIATAGVDDAGHHGVWVARNDGTEATRVVRAEDAMISEVVFSENSGFFLSFIATRPDGASHVHELTLVGEDGTAVHNEFDASIALETTTTLTGLRANPWTDEIALTEGSCDDPDGPRARLTWSDEPVFPEPAATEAVGWIAASRLLVVALPEGCEGPRDLWIVDTDAASDEELLVRNVGPAVAVRAVLPEPPLALGNIDLEEFA